MPLHPAEYVQYLIVFHAQYIDKCVRYELCILANKGNSFIPMYYNYRQNVFVLFYPLKNYKPSSSFVFLLNDLLTFRSFLKAPVLA